MIEYQNWEAENINVKDELQKLLDDGKKFTYDNFARFGGHGYPIAFTMEYVGWKTKVRAILELQFGLNSQIMSDIEKAEKIGVIGGRNEHFFQAHGHYLGAILAGIDLIDFNPGKTSNKEQMIISNRKIFIVHGHDDLLKNQIENLIKSFGLEPIVLHREPDEGKTVIEKFEKYSDVGYAFILLTPDDYGYDVTEASKEESKRNIELRARQNVIFEFGYFAGKLGRNRVCCLHKSGVKLPTDLHGIIYKEIHNDVNEKGLEIFKELKAVGYDIKI